MKSRICSLWSPLNRPGTDFMFSQYRLYYTVNNIIGKPGDFNFKFYQWGWRWNRVLVLSPLSLPWFSCFRNNFTLSKKMLKPFAPPPPSSFGVLPACTVSLSDPLSAVFISHKESMWKRRQNSDWCDLEGPLWWIRLPAATSTTRMGKSRKSWLASGESLFW